MNRYERLYINHDFISFSAIQIYDLSYIFISILHLLWVCYELTMSPAFSWLDSSVGRALPQYLRGHGFKSRSGPSFFYRLYDMIFHINLFANFCLISQYNNHLMTSDLQYPCELFVKPYFSKAAET